MKNNFIFKIYVALPKGCGGGHGGRYAQEVRQQMDFLHRIVDVECFFSCRSLRGQLWPGFAAFELGFGEESLLLRW